MRSVYMRSVYIVLCLLGTLLPLSQFLPWTFANGINIPLLIQDITASRISAFAWADVFVSALVLIVFILAECRRSRMPLPWLPFLALLTVGVSLAFPLFLLQREQFLAKAANRA